MNERPEVDSGFQKDKDIKELKKQIQKLKSSTELQQNFPPIKIKPVFFEPDLFKAVIKGKLDNVQYLIEKQGVNIDQQTTQDDEKNNVHKGETALHVACENNQQKIAQYLILKGANIEANNGAQQTPLHVACKYGHFEIVQYLIEKGADTEAKDNDQWTPLHIACKYGHLPIVQCLIENGANIEAKDFDEKTPFYIACSKRHLPIVKYLISKGARYDVQKKNYHGQSLFIFACENKDKKFIQSILSLETISIPVDKLCIKYPLHHACSSDKGNFPVVQYLIEKGANIEAKDNSQWTPLHIACWNGHLPVVQYLIEKGANIEANSKYGTPLHIASYHGHTNVVKYLVSKGAQQESKCSLDESKNTSNE